MKQPVSPIEPIGELLARLANWTLAIAMAAAFILFGGDAWIERLASLAAAVVALNAITGFGMLTIDQARHHWLEEFHELAATTLIVAVFAHLAWMLREALLRGEGLARRIAAPLRKKHAVDSRATSATAPGTSS